MESKDQKIKEIISIVCNHQGINASLLESKSRETPIPYLKKLVAYMLNRHLSMNTGEIANFLKFANHSNVVTHLKKLNEQMGYDKKLKNEIGEINTIIIEKGLSKYSNKNNKWFLFLDLNDFYIATKSDKSILFHNHSLAEIEYLLGPGWEIVEHTKTKKFLFQKYQNLSINQ